LWEKGTSPVAETSINFFSQVRLKGLPGVASLLLCWVNVRLVRKKTANVYHTHLNDLLIKKQNMQ
jgi:hypothetical protein